MAIAASAPVYEQIPTWETSEKREPKDDLGMNQFLTMLVAQLKNQDPLNPLNGTDFTAQLAQFSALEQQYRMNENLADIQTVLSAQQQGSVIDYIGKTVKTNDNTMVAKDGQAESGAYTLARRAEVTVHIYDDLGRQVRKIYKGWQDPGEYDVAWDGLDNKGEPSADGTYSFEVQAKDAQGLIVSYDAYVTGEVTGVTYARGIPYLMIGDRSVTPGSIVEVTKTEEIDQLKD